MRKYIGIVIMFLLCLNIVNSISLDDLVDSYNFSYSSPEFNLKYVNSSLINDTLNIVLNVSSKSSEYIFHYYLSSLNSDNYLNKVESLNLNYEEQLVELDMNITTLEEADYKLSLEVVSNDLAIYRNENLATLNLIKQNGKSLNLMSVNFIQTQDSSILDVEVENLPKKIVSSFAILKDDRGVEYKFDLITNTSNQLIFEKYAQELIDNNVSQLILDKIIFVSENITYGLLDNSIFNVDLSLFSINSNYDNLVGNTNNNSSIHLSDLEVISLDYNQSSGNCSVIIKNNGDADAIRFYLRVIDENFNIVDEKLFNYLIVNQSLNLSYTFSSNLSQIYAFVDYYGQIEESNESNNIMFWPKAIVNNFIIKNENSGLSEGSKGSRAGSLDGVSKSESVKGEFNKNITSNNTIYNYTKVNLSISNHFEQKKSISISSKGDWKSIENGYFAINSQVFNQFPLSVFNVSGFKFKTYSFEYGLICLDLELWERWKLF